MKYPDEPNEKLPHIVIPVVSGIIFGGVISVPFSFMIGALLATTLGVSSFEGGSGYFALMVTMILFPIMTVLLVLFNIKMSNSGKSLKKMVFIEFALALITITVSVSLGFYY